MSKAKNIHSDSNHLSIEEYGVQREAGRKSQRESEGTHKRAYWKEAMAWMIVGAAIMWLGATFTGNWITDSQRRDYVNKPFDELLNDGQLGGAELYNLEVCLYSPEGEQATDKNIEEWSEQCRALERKLGAMQSIYTTMQELSIEPR